MSPATRLRLSTDSDRYDASQMYLHAHHHNNTTPYNRVFIDSAGQPHDPDFVSHIFPNPTPAQLRARRRAKKARRLSETGLIQEDDDSEEEMPSEAEESSMDPFRSYANRRSAQSYYSPTSPMAAHAATAAAMPAAYRQFDQRRSRYASPTPTSSASNSPPSWQHTASLLHQEDSSSSPVSERWRVRRWSRSSKSGDDEEETEKGNRRRLRKRRTTLSELNEDDDDDDDGRTGTFQSSEVPEDEDCAPTCTQVLRSQWQALVLRVTLSTHRAKRRLLPRKPHNEKYGMGT